MVRAVFDVVIEEVDVRSLRDPAIDELNVFGNLMRAESEPGDPPVPDDVARIAYRNIPALDVVRGFVARDPAGAIVGTAETSWTRSEDNQHLMMAEIAVAPTHRRRGIARKLLESVVGAAEDAGKTTLIGHGTDRAPAGEAFAKRIGGRPGLVGHTNRLVLADVDRDQLRRWIDEGPVRAPGYALLAHDGRHPDDLVDEIVELYDVMNTAPRDDLDMEDQTETVERWREREKSFHSQGGETWILLARHDETARLVGWTEVGWLPHQPQTVWQWGTGVRPEHRGHALGKWLKATMLERILTERPYAVDVRTHNADSNDPMLGINHAMGFKPYRTDTHWQVSVASARSYLEGSS